VAGVARHPRGVVVGHRVAHHAPEPPGRLGRVAHRARPLQGAQEALLVEVFGVGADAAAEEVHEARPLRLDGRDDAPGRELLRRLHGYAPALRACAAAHPHEGGQAQLGGHWQVAPQQHSPAAGARPWAAQLHEGPHEGHPQVFLSLMCRLLVWLARCTLQGPSPVMTGPSPGTLHPTGRSGW
jgi:hypothetical protein